MEVPLPHGCRWRTFSFNVGYANARQRKTLILSVWKGYRMCVTLSHIQNLKRILVWNWQLLKQARIRSWESWSARWSYRWATSRKDCPACAGQVNGCAGRMWWTYAQTLSEEFPAASPWVWPERQMRGVRCAGWPRPGVAFPAYDSKTEPHGIVFTYRKDTFGESFFSSVPLYFQSVR